MTRLIPLAALALAACGPEAPSARTAPPAHAPPHDEGEPALPRLTPGTRPLDGQPALDVAPPPAGCPAVRVTSADGLPLRVRPDPSTENEALGLLPVGATATVTGVVEDGEVIEGDPRWFQVDAGDLHGFVSAPFVACVDPAQRVPGFFLPFACGTSANVTQGNNTSFSHNGLAAYAFDFAMPRGTPVVAIDDGVVIYSIVNSGPGDPCYDGGGSSCSTGVNHVLLQHPDGTTSRYAHLDAPAVNEGDLVLRGEVVGFSGTSGWSTGPHLHLARAGGDCGSPWCQSIPLSFAEVGVPDAGDVVTSENCE